MGVHTLAWIGAAVLAVLELVGVGFPALELAVLAGAIGEVADEGGVFHRG